MHRRYREISCPRGSLIEGCGRRAAPDASPKSQGILASLAAERLSRYPSLRPRRYGRPFLPYFRTISHFMPYHRAARKRAALRTSDFDVACGHLMVVMAATKSLKRQPWRSAEPERRSSLLGAFSHT